MKKRDKIKLEIIVIVEVMAEKDMSREELIEEFSSESLYNFEGTDNVTVIDTNFIDCTEL